MSFKPIFELLQIDLLRPHAVILVILDNSVYTNYISVKFFDVYVHNLALGKYT